MTSSSNIQAPTPDRTSASPFPSRSHVTAAGRRQEEWGVVSGQLISGGGDGRPVARHVTFADRHIYSLVGLDVGDWDFYFTAFDFFDMG